MATRLIDIVGKSTLRQTGAVLKRCHLYVGNDAGPMHLAAAASLSVIEISCHPLGGSPFHSNSPSRFRPWGVPHVVLQPEEASHPCSVACSVGSPHCILNISVEQVKDAVVTNLCKQGSLVPQERT